MKGKPAAGRGAGVAPRRLRAWLLLLPLCAGCAAPEPTTAQPETVVLLHGMARTRASMLVMRLRFESAGYHVLNFPYDQSASSLDEISAQLVAFLGSDVETDRYHLIGHSLGNVIIRNGFRVGYPPGLGRIVMLAPPNRPAQFAGVLKDNALYRGIAGDAGQRLADEGFFRELPVPSVDFGVLAGDRGQALTFDEPNDGVVAVSTTKLDGMADFRVLHHTHTFLMNTVDTFEHCESFLRHGHFVD